MIRFIAATMFIAVGLLEFRADGAVIVQERVREELFVDSYKWCVVCKRPERVEITI